MAKPMQLGHTNIRVSNLARSEAFYTEALGLEVVSRRENGVNLSAREHSQEIVLREISPNDREQESRASDPTTWPGRWRPSTIYRRSATSSFPRGSSCSGFAPTAIRGRLFQRSRRQ